MKRILFTIACLLLLVSCTRFTTEPINTTIDNETLSKLGSIYNKSDITDSFDDWLKTFDSYEITYSNEYTYMIGSKDTRINIFSYDTFELVDEHWVIDGIKTNAKVYDTPTLTNLTIEYGDDGYWYVNGHNTGISIQYRTFKVILYMNGVSIKENINRTIYVLEGSNYTLENVSALDYTFLGWSKDNTTDNLLKGKITITGETELYAMWEHEYLSLELNQDDKYEVKGLNKEVEDITIPEKLNGKKVTKITNEFLSKNSSKVKSIIIPSSIEYVEDNTFDGLFNITLSVGSKSQTDTWASSWRSGSYVEVNYKNGEKDDYYLEDDLKEVLSDYFFVSRSGNVPLVTTTDSDFNREFYYWSSGVTSTQKFTSNGIVVDITSPKNLDSYILQVNDLNGTMPLIKGLKYNITFSIKPNKSNTKIAVSIHKDNNSQEYYHKEYNLVANEYNVISTDFICEDPSLFFKIYMGEVSASYTVKNISISYDHIDYIENEIRKSIPEAIYNSFSLPVINEPDTSVRYESNYSSIINGKDFVYIDPKGNEKVLIESVITYKDKTYIRQYETKIKSPSTNIPEIRITLSGSDTISNTDDYTLMSLDFIEYSSLTEYTTILSGETGGIRIRGNSTRGFPKKAYRIKFDSKVSFFGLPKAKSWVLLANHADQSLMRNYYAFTIGKLFDNMDYVPSAYFVDLYVDDVYYGNYLLTEQMQVGKGRVDIESKKEVIDTGYLLEYDFHIADEVEGVDYFNIDSSQSVYFIKSPDRSDGLTDEQFEYIKNYMISVDTAIKNRSGYLDLIDVDSFIDFFIMQELFKNIDCNQGSIYMYKEAGSKLKMGPLWDFDLSCGNDAQDYNAVKTDGWFAFLDYKNQWFNSLMKDEYFVDLFIKRWHEKYPEILEVIETIYDTYDYIEESALRNFEVDDVIGKEYSWYTVDKIYKIKTYEGQVDYLYNWLKDRAEWINNNIDKLAK